MRLARQITLLGAEAQARIERAQVDVPGALPGAHYAERYLRGAGVGTVTTAITKDLPPEGPPFAQLLDARAQELLRGSYFALSQLRSRTDSAEPPERA